MYRVCEAGVWTVMWEGPTWGATNLWAPVPVGVSWRRYSSGFPWFGQGFNAIVGQTTVLHGGPSLYCRLEVNPTFTTLMVST